MKLIRYSEPNHPFDDWDTFFADPFRAFAPLFRTPLTSAPRRQHGEVEWYENDDNYFARIEMPWVKREDLQIDAEDGLVRFAYEHRDPAVADGEKATGSERFEQVLRSPDGVDVTGIEARLEEGILTLTLPKAAERKPVSVKIQ